MREKEVEGRRSSRGQIGNEGASAWESTVVGGLDLGLEGWENGEDRCSVKMQLQLGTRGSRQKYERTNWQET